MIACTEIDSYTILTGLRKAIGDAKYPVHIHMCPRAANVLRRDYGMFGPLLSVDGHTVICDLPDTHPIGWELETFPDCVWTWLVVGGPTRGVAT